jgi:hypothetical protein
MYHLQSSARQLPIRAESLGTHFKIVLQIVQRCEKLRIGLLEHSYQAFPDRHWIFVFGRHRMRLRFYLDEVCLRVQQADAPSDDWQPDWVHIKADTFNWHEHSSEYEILEKILFERFAA